MRKTIILLLFISPIFSSAQSRPGFIYNFSPEYSYTSVISSSNFNDKVVVTNMMSNYKLPPGHIRRRDQFNITILDSALSRIDTTFELVDTSAKYIYAINYHVVVDDTAYFLIDCVVEDTTKPSQFLYPANLMLVKMDKDYNLFGAKYLFEQDTLGALMSRWELEFKFNEHLGSFDIFLMKYDTLPPYHIDIILTRLDRNGEVRYFKEWDYTVVTYAQAFITDHQYLGNGRYLLPLKVTNDIYVIADTAKAEIDTSYYKPEIRALYDVQQKKNSYILFGTSDGHDILSFKEGKLQYVFLELDKQTLQEKSRYVYKVPDTWITG